MWPLDLKLLKLNGRDWITLGQALLSIIIFGATGSGKTSGPFQYIIRALMRVRCGGLFLCVKQDAAESYRRWAKEEGREADVINFSIGSGHGFNFLQYLSNQRTDPGLIVEMVVYVLMETLDILSRHTMREDRFFREAAKELFRNICLVLYIAEGSIRLEALAEMLSNVPRDANQARSTSTYFGQMLEKAWKNAAGTPLEAQMTAVIRFFTVDWANYAIETRESIRATAQVLINELTHPPLVNLFGRETTVTPDDVHAGKLIIVDIPIHFHQRVGQIAATIFKTSVQRETLARRERNEGVTDESKIRTIFIAGDEAHELVTRGDETFVSSCRELRGITVYATQTINNFVKQLEKPTTLTLLAGLRTRFIARTEDADTANWVRDTLGQSLNPGLYFGPETWTHLDRSAFGTEILRSLKQGGGKGKKVEAIAILGGDVFNATNRRWYKATFRQNIPKKTDKAKQFWQSLTSNDVTISATTPEQRKEEKS